MSGCGLGQEGSSVGKIGQRIMQSFVLPHLSFLTQLLHEACVLERHGKMVRKCLQSRDIFSPEGRHGRPRSDQHASRDAAPFAQRRDNHLSQPARAEVGAAQSALRPPRRTAARPAADSVRRR